jgi:hypothetical protein
VSARKKEMQPMRKPPKLNFKYIDYPVDRTNLIELYKSLETNTQFQASVKIGRSILNRSRRNKNSNDEQAVTGSAVPVKLKGSGTQHTADQDLSASSIRVSEKKLSKPPIKLAKTEGHAPASAKSKKGKATLPKRGKPEF